MNILFLLLFLLSSLNAQGRYVVGKKRDILNSYSAETVCLNKGKDSIALSLKEEVTVIPLDSVSYLDFKEHKPWRPYLLAAALVGGSTYAALHFSGEDGPMYSAEGKARLAGILSGVFVLATGAVIKSAVETHILIHASMGIRDVRILTICTF